MKDKYHIWYYLKDFAVFNSNYNKFYLSTDLVVTIYSYLIDELKKEIFNNYLKNSINRQTNKFYPNIFGYKNDDIIIYYKNIPYNFYSKLQLSMIIEELIDNKEYSYKDFKYNNKKMISTYTYKNHILESKFLCEIH